LSGRPKGTMQMSITRVDDTAKSPQPHISQIQTKTVSSVMSNEMLRLYILIPSALLYTVSDATYKKFLRNFQLYLFQL